MQARLTQLIPAILTYVIERDSYVSKTKLLKLLYLFDVEWYRVHRATYTGFDWVFYHLGPWTREYDPILHDLADRLVIRVRRTTNPEYDTEFLSASKPTEYTQLFDSYREEFILRDVLSTWGERSTAEILDYVYFWTEPMKNAERYERLDFSTIPTEPPIKYQRESSGSTTEEIAAARERILEAVKSLRSIDEKSSFPEQRYDEEYFDAIKKFEP